MARKSEGYVYFILEPMKGLVKIGYSADPDARYRNLVVEHDQLLCRHAFIPGGRLTEGRLHDRFRPYRFRREWFIVAGKLHEYLETLTGTWKLSGTLGEFDLPIPGYGLHVAAMNANDLMEAGMLAPVKP